MLSRFVTTSRTRIINPRYVVPCTLQLLVLMAPSLFSSLLFLLPISSRESERVLVQQPTGPLLRAGWLEGRNTYDFFHLLSPLNTHPSFATAPLPWSRPNEEHPTNFSSTASCCICTGTRARTNVQSLEEAQEEGTSTISSCFPFAPAQYSSSTS